MNAAADLRHPKGTYLLILTEMWERFSYYGMRALLIFYLINSLEMDGASAAKTYGGYTSLVYAACIAGGWMSDRFLGQWRSVALGAAIILMGHVMLILEELSGGAPEVRMQIFFLALALIVVGTGLFKPSSTSLFGRLYGPGDPRRAQGFRIFYVGINLGSAGAALICGYLGQAYGWSAGFGAAAVGMILGLAVLGYGKPWLQPFAAVPHTTIPQLIPITCILLAVMFVWLLMQVSALVGFVLIAGLLFALVHLARFMKGAEVQDRRRLFAILALIAAAAVFWSLFEQAGSSINMFTAGHVDLTFGPLTLLPAQAQFFNPAFILLSTPLLGALWAWLAARGMEPGVTGKHVLALIQVSAGFACLVVGIAVGEAGRVAGVWLILAYLLHTMGELCLAPTAYTAVSELAPQKVESMLMGLWLFSLAVGNFVGGQVAARVLQGVTETAGTGIDVFPPVFMSVVVTGLTAALVLALMSWKIERWARGQ